MKQIVSEQAKVASPSKAQWIQPVATVAKARAAEITGGGTGDGSSCHS